MEACASTQNPLEFAFVQTRGFFSLLVLIP